MYKETNPKPVRGIIAYLIGIIFLYLSVFLSQHIKYDGNFTSVIPILFPLVFAMAAIGISILFILGQEYPWFFRTGIMSLVNGITMFVFGMISFHFKISSVIWAGSLGIGILFILAAIVRLIIQRGLSAYRKVKN